jgi:DNA-binding transcriptional MerR regulator
MTDVAGAENELLTIDELAQRTGLTTRNIRAYQSRGLLPPPEVRGRTGYYGDEHVARLELVREMQADGFNLTAIKRLIEGAHGAWEDVLGFKRVAFSGWVTEEPELTTVSELAKRFGSQTEPGLLERSIELGLVVPLGGDRLELPSPSLVRAAEDVVALGIPLGAALDLMTKVLRHSEAISSAFTRMFLERVIKPFTDAGAPADEWPRVREALERVRPLAGQALASAFSLRMTAAAEEAFGRVLAGEDWPTGARGAQRRRSDRSGGSRGRSHAGRRHRRGTGSVG